MRVCVCAHRDKGGWCCLLKCWVLVLSSELFENKYYDLGDTECLVAFSVAYLLPSLTY